MHKLCNALLEYQLDDFANDIAGLSEEEIVDVYSMGLYSINKIKKFVEKHGNHCNFETRPTLLYSTKKDKNIIKEIIKSDDFDEIKKYILNYIKEINKQVPAYKAISVNNVIFTEEELIKTTTLKIKRHEEMKKIMNVSN